VVLRLCEGLWQALATLLRERKAGGHRCLIFTQMSKMLDILEVFLNLHGHTYLRLDGSTKVRLSFASAVPCVVLTRRRCSRCTLAGCVTDGSTQQCTDLCALVFPD
jgi:hypothetical protein